MQLLLRMLLLPWVHAMLTVTATDAVIVELIIHKLR
jgi:hypothetical protein